MINLNRISITGITAGLIYGFVTIIQYWIRYNDIDKFLSNMSIAVLIIAASYLYDQSKKHELDLEGKSEDIQVLHERITDLEQDKRIQ